MKIGVFALQGAFIEHERALRALGADTVEIRRREHYQSLDGVVLCGGESTVQGKLLREAGLMEPLKRDIEAGLPVFGTCAGMILLASGLSNDESVYLGTMSAIVRRNAYGRQLGSFQSVAQMEGVGEYPMVFIRAPFVEKVYGDARSLAEVDGHIVAVRQKNMLATAFHPELTDDLRVHQYFLGMIG